MLNSNLQVGKYYKEQSGMADSFRYIKADEVVVRDSNIMVKGNAVTVFGDRYDDCEYFDQGAWIETTKKEYDEAYSNARIS